jgi:hypothetical protein
MADTTMDRTINGLGPEFVGEFKCSDIVAATPYKKIIDPTDATVCPNQSSFMGHFDQYQMVDIWYEAVSQANDFAIGTNYLVWEPDISEEKATAVDLTKLQQFQVRAQSKSPKQVVRLRIPDSPWLYVNGPDAEQTLASLIQRTHGKFIMMSTMISGDSTTPKVLLYFHYRIKLRGFQPVPVVEATDPEIWSADAETGTGVVAELGQPSSLNWDTTYEYFDYTDNWSGHGVTTRPMRTGPVQWAIATAADSFTRNSVADVLPLTSAAKTAAGLASKIAASPFASRAIKSFSYGGFATAGALDILGYLLIETGDIPSLVTLDYDENGQPVTGSSSTAGRAFPGDYAHSSRDKNRSFPVLGGNSTSLPAGYSQPVSYVLLEGDATAPSAGYAPGEGWVAGATPYLFNTSIRAMTSSYRIRVVLAPNTKYALSPPHAAAPAWVQKMSANPVSGLTGSSFYQSASLGIIIDTSDTRIHNALNAARAARGVPLISREFIKKFGLDFVTALFPEGSDVCPDPDTVWKPCDGTCRSKEPTDVEQALAFQKLRPPSFSQAVEEKHSSAHTTLCLGDDEIKVPVARFNIVPDGTDPDSGDESDVDDAIEEALLNMADKQTKRSDALENKMVGLEATVANIADNVAKLVASFHR